jgi:hypothetical protein
MLGFRICETFMGVLERMGVGTNDRLERDGTGGGFGIDGAVAGQRAMEPLDGSGLMELVVC